MPRQLCCGVRPKITNFFTRGDFNQIYLEAEDELKNRFSEQQFASYLKAFKDNGMIDLKEVSHVWLSDELDDAIKRTVFKKTKFSNVELVSTDKALFRQTFVWNLKSGEPKLVAYEVKKVCDKPCHLEIKTK